MDLRDIQAALDLGDSVDEGLASPTKGDGVSGEGSGVQGPTVARSAKSPTTLGDVQGDPDEASAEALASFRAGMKRIRSELESMAVAFQAAVPVSTSGPGLAQATKAVLGLKASARSVEDVVSRALELRRSIEGVAQRSPMKEEPLTYTSDADRSSEPRKKLDAGAQEVVDLVDAELDKMTEEVRELGHELQTVVGTTNRPDAIRGSIGDLSEAENTLTNVRQKILSRFR